MEAVLKNLASTAELLAVASHSAAVEQWDERTLSRAFHWAQYCEHVFFRFHNNQAIRGAAEKQLQLTAQRLRAALPDHHQVAFSDLFRCRHLLLIGLLNNPKLPGSIMKILFDTKNPVDTKDNEYQDVTGFCSRLVQYKSACKVLRPLTDQSLVGADAEVQGMMLMTRLSALLGQGSDACRTEHSLDSVLQGCEGQEEHFCLVIAAALLTPEDSPTTIASQDFLLNWLQKKHNVLQGMCSALHTTLLGNLAKKHVKFRGAYTDLVKRWASDMEYSVNDGVWFQTHRSPTVSFQKLSEHFQTLFEACPADVEQELTALKISDGNFDISGLSIWGDLLSVLTK
ncbi:Fanconi anemia group F protein [Betta splendens]|uniref:Fanconi anemia group F protein n=1 Tax=Betta splendens TaxID=158456 RepID=A0A6P7MV18_BETSP|nr:Fanconi anemia group F protein [Betta splendens]